MYPVSTLDTNLPCGYNYPQMPEPRSYLQVQEEENNLKKSQVDSLVIMDRQKPKIRPLSQLSDPDPSFESEPESNPQAETCTGEGIAFESAVGNAINAVLAASMGSLVLFL